MRNMPSPKSIQKIVLLFFVICSTLFIHSCSSVPAETSANNEFVPQWVKEVVWYQIFPERFCNGDTTNDPTLTDVAMAFPFDSNGPWEIHPWNSDWYEMQDYEKQNGKDIWHNLQRRRYGGDLQGIINKLDYLQELGVTAIYLNPIFAAPSLHKYDAISLHHVEPSFGPNPEGDRQIMAAEKADDPSTWQWTSADLLAIQLIEEVHKRDMYIIFDGVFNHMGYNSFAFQDVVKNQEKSVYKDWFSVTSWEDSTKGTKFEYEGWFGHKSLPEFKEDSLGLGKDVSKYIYAVTERWMRPEIKGVQYSGIDGWRLDVAFCVDHDFWKRWRTHVKELKPDAYLTAEVVDSIGVVKEYLQGDEFDAIMNYNFAFASTNFFLESEFQTTPAEFNTELAELRNAFPTGVSYVQQNLYNSHDANRLSSHIANAGMEKYSNWGEYFGKSMGSNAKYETKKPDSEDYELQKLMALFQMTYVGAPMIYYGDEVGMWGANDPDCRKPMLWNNIKYEDERYNADQSLLNKPNKVVVNSDIHAYYKKLIHIRNTYKPLQTGDFKNRTPKNADNIFAFSRKQDNEELIIIVNRSSEAESIDLNLEGKYINVLEEDNDSIIDLTDEINIGSKAGLILKKV